jgi:hypothetical protein
LFCFSAAIIPAAHATAPTTKLARPATALGGFVKDRAMARVLGETLFRDTMDVMSDVSNQTPAESPAAPSTSSDVPAAAANTTGTASIGAAAAPASAGRLSGSGRAQPPDQSRDNGAAGRVARTVLAHQKLDKYLWLIQQAYDDTLWRGGDRIRIEQHFPLIWRTSIMLYEATLNASPHRVRVCTPGDDGDSFDCRDEVERARIVPIPAQAPIISSSHEPTTG